MSRDGTRLTGLAVTGAVLALIPWIEAAGRARSHLLLDLSLHLLAWGLVLGLFWRRGRIERPVGLLALAPAFGLAVLSAASAAYGFAAWLRLFEWATALAVTAAVCGGMLGNDGPRRARLATLVVVAALPASIVAVIQALGGQRGAAGFVSPNHLGAWLAATVPLALVLAARPSGEAARSRRVSWLLAAGLLLAGVLATGSRGALLGLAVAGGAASVALGTRRRWGRRQWLRAGAVAAVFVGLALGALSLRFADGTDIYRYDRLRIWQSAGAVWAESPWMGIGPGQFTLRAAAHNFPRTDDVVRYGRVFHSPHSHLLLWSAECGLLAVLALAAGLWTGSRAARRHWLDRARGRLVAAGAAGGLTVLAVISLVDEPLERPAILIGAALLLALALPTRPAPATLPVPYGRSLAATAVLLMVLAGAVVPTVSQDLALRARQAPDAMTASRLYERAARLNPWQAYHPGEHAALMLSLAARPLDAASYGRIRVAIERAIELAPRESSFWVTRARLDRRGCIELFRDAATCRRSLIGYERAAAMAPKDARILREAAALAVLLDDGSGARALLERAVALEPFYVAAWTDLLQLARDQGRAADADRAEEALRLATGRVREASAESPYARAILGRGDEARPHGEGS